MRQIRILKHVQKVKTPKQERTLHVSDSISVHHQKSNTVHTAMCLGHTIYADCLLAGSGWSSILIPLVNSQQNLYNLYKLLCVQC